MDSPPVPKPRTGFVSASQCEPLKRPVPLPRTKIPKKEISDRVRASDVFHSIGTISKQISEDVAQTVQISAKSVNEKFEKSIQDGSKFAKGTLEKTISTSRAMRDTVTKSVIEGTKSAGLRLRWAKKNENIHFDSQRCMSMPDVDMRMFDNIQFHSPLLEQKKYREDGQAETAHTDQAIPSTNLNYKNFDDLSLFSSNSDSNTDSVSNFSHESRDFECNMSLNSESEQLTYDTPRVSRANSVVGVANTPEIPERINRRVRSNVDFMRQNSLYENWNLPGDPLPSNTETNTRLSKSTIYEFDPLNLTEPKYEGISNELLLLKSYLSGDTYGNIACTVGSDDHEDNIEEFIETDYFNPPTPPERSDSLLNTEPEKNTSDKSKDKNSNWFIDNDSKPVVDDANKSPNTSVIQKFSNMLKLDNMLHKSVKQNIQKVESVERPGINTNILFYSGILTRIISGPSGVEDLFKNSQTRYCVLSEQKLMCYLDSTNMILKETFNLESVVSVQIVLPLSSSPNNNYCFELSLAATAARGSPRKIVFSTTSQSDRRNWAQKIVEHLTTAFPTKYIAEFTRCGWCYLKEGVSGEWQGAWVMLVRRVLVYSAKDGATKSLDLRKMRCVVNHESDEETKKYCPTDGSANLLLDCPDVTLYLRFPYERELKGWRCMVKLAAHNNGNYMHHQQLTKEDVPTIVDKCISFIYAHGSMSEGIYRRAGSSSVLTTLLERFRRDSWSVQLSPGTHSEHDVAGVLKRFFRDLPEPLIPQDKHKALIDALRLEDENARHAQYRCLLTDLPLVPRRTARKLFAHLNFVHSMAHTNKMAAENLASVWAPTIMPTAVTSTSIQTAWSSKEVFVIRDLIAGYEAIWQPTETEKRREAAIRCILMKVMSHMQPTSPKAAGDLKAWIYIKDRNVCSQVALTPNKTAADICIELSEKANTESHFLMLQEVICNENMRRIIHIDEIVLDVVLRWGYWDEEDRKDNYIVVKENKSLYELEAIKTTSLVCGELKFASESSKAFKMYMFDLKAGKLGYFKDKQGSHLLEEWCVKDILWYTGHEAKRNPQTRWSITFIPRNNKQKRAKDRPWFGCTIGGAVTEDQLKWMAALMFAEHTNILPTPRLVIT